MCFRNTFSLLVCVQAQFLPPCSLTRGDEPFPVPSGRQPEGCSTRRPRSTQEHEESKAQPRLRCPISPLDRDRLGLLSAKWAKLDGTTRSGCPCAERGPEDSSDGAKRGHLRGVDLLLLLGFSGIPEDEVQLLTWLQVGVNMLQLLLLAALDFYTVQVFFRAFWVFFTYRMEITPLPCVLELLGGLVE